MLLIKIRNEESVQQKDETARILRDEEGTRRSYAKKNIKGIKLLGTKGQ